MRQHNRQLAAAGNGLRLEIRQHRLGLRGPLPCPKGTAARPVQRISLGLPATAEGVAAALDQLARVREAIERGRFSWEHWRRRPAAPAPSPAPSPAAVVAGEPSAAPEGLTPLLAGFEAAFFADPRRRRRPAGSRSTWSGAYRPYLRRLAAVAAASGATP